HYKFHPRRQAVDEGIGIDIKPKRNILWHECLPFLQRAGGHQGAIELDDLSGRAVGSNAVLIDANGSVKIVDEIQVVRDHDKLLLQARKLAADAVAVAQVQKSGGFVGTTNFTHAGKRWMKVSAST
ncbi:hypothetical protein HT105_22235, partial [Bacteroides fragilis]|nr:hypothetical protein [Bacteroides fragilis]